MNDIVMREGRAIPVKMSKLKVAGFVSIYLFQTYGWKYSFIHLGSTLFLSISLYHFPKVSKGSRYNMKATTFDKFNQLPFLTSVLSYAVQTHEFPFWQLELFS